MADQGGQQARLGATFYPGGSDDFYMPELISPSPQRIMPEVPSNMQDELAHLELEAREVSLRDHESRRRESSISTVSSLTPYGDQQPSSSFPVRDSSQFHNPVQPQPPQGYTAEYENTNASAYQNAYNNGGQTQQRNSYTTTKNQQPLPQRPSIFPKLQNVGPNVPPSDEDKEEVLERARSLVLNSNDPEMQLAWAQDALLWVEAALGHRQRLNGDQTIRSTTPKIEHQLRVDAISIINFLAEQQHPKAVFLKGTWHEFGKFGYALDKRESMHLYRLAAEKGYARAEYRIGTQYEGLQEMGKAIKHYTMGVEMKDSASNYRLGMMTLLGQHGQQQDYQKAIEQIRFAANTADENAPQGAYVYGMLLSRELPNITIPDLFLPVDIDQAKQFIEKAAYLGFAKAQQKMGEAYELCLLGCDFNPALSLHYNSLAARQGDPAADMAISKWFLCGYEGVFAKNEELAFTYAQRSASGGLPTAEFALGYFYEIGMYVKKDVEAAKAWYNKAAEHGNKDAISRLQGISQQKVLNKQDHEQTAINRIRSQYGSKRGQRPDRFKEKAPPMPTISDDIVEFPEPNRRLSASLPRPQSVAPYPDERPKSVAPYPEDDMAAPGHRTSSLRPLSGPIADRPSSAFGIRPLNLAPNTQQGMGQMRPSSSLGTMPLPQSVPQGRTDPAHRQRVVSAGWEPQAPNYHGQGPPPRASYPVQPPQQSGYDNPQGRGKLQKPHPDAYGQQQPTLPQIRQPGAGAGYPVTPVDPYQSKPLPSSQSRHNGLPSNPAAGRQGRPNPQGNYDARSSLPSSGGQPVQRPDRVDSAPQSAGRMSQQQPQRPVIPTQNSTQSLPPRVASATPVASPALNSPASAATVPSTKPQKEGPKTFDEMGIPVQKNDSECVVM